jgi:hypothetical protein
VTVSYNWRGLFGIPECRLKNNIKTDVYKIVRGLSRVMWQRRELGEIIVWFHKNRVIS